MKDLPRRRKLLDNALQRNIVSWSKMPYASSEHHSTSVVPFNTVHLGAYLYRNIDTPQNGVTFDGSNVPQSYDVVVYSLKQGGSLSNCVISGANVQLVTNDSSGAINDLKIESGGQCWMYALASGVPRFSEGMTVTSKAILVCYDKVTIKTVLVTGDGSKVYGQPGSVVEDLTLDDHASAKLACLQRGTLRGGSSLTLEGSGVHSTKVDVYDAQLTVDAGHFVDGLTMHVGAIVTSNGTITDLHVDGGTITVGQAGSVNGFEISAGGVLKLTGQSVGAGTVRSGGSLELTASTIALQGSLTLEIGAQLRIDGLSAAGASLRFEKGVLSLISDAGRVLWSVVLQGDYDPNGFQISTEGSDCEIRYEPGAPCFCPGTLIRMADGMEQRVEAINPGDKVAIWEAETWQQKTVVWVGHRDVQAVANRPLDQSGFPVRIRKGAFADGCPHTDLLISAEHCIYHGGSFVPARMLVNGGSIAYDLSQPRPRYLHIETEDHAVISSNGLLSETFLDTGNRTHFRVSRFLLDGRKSRRKWCRNAVVPLNTTQHFVEKLYRDLETRSCAMGFTLSTSAPQPKGPIAVVAQDGSIAKLRKVKGQRYVFDLPPKVESVTIMSDVTRPCDEIGPFVDDRRALGLLIGRISIAHENAGIMHLHEVVDHLSRDDLDGWHDRQPGASLRWTQARASLPLQIAAQYADAQLILHVHGGAPNQIDMSEDESRQEGF